MAEQQNKNYKAVFSVSIETNNEYQYRGEHNKSRNDIIYDRLVPGGKYWFDKEIYATYNELKEFAINILNNELKEECNEFLDIPINEIKVKSVYKGSIELFFTVLFGVIAGVTGIKDLHDSIDFLRTFTEKKLEKRLQENYGDYFRIDIKTYIPSDRRYYDDLEYLHKCRIMPVYNSHNAIQPKRDGFFYYLLISNIVLLVIVIALIANAVVKIYFYRLYLNKRGRNNQQGKWS